MGALNARGPCCTTRHRRARWSGAVLAVVVAALVATLTTIVAVIASPETAAAAPVGAVTDLARAVRPGSVVAGPDGNLWFTSEETGTVGRMTVSGSVTTFVDPSISAPGAITVGADGNLWFVDDYGIDRMTPHGTVSRFTSALIGANPAAITSGPDGNLWFLGSDGHGTIGRITLDGTITTFGLLDGSATYPTSITTGADGNLWIGGQGFVARMTTAGQPTIVARGFPFYWPSDLALGPDGNVWAADAGRIHRITPDGGVTSFSDTTTDGAEGITAGPDGALWFTNAGSDTIGRITTAGAISSFADPSIALRPWQLANRAEITVGADGAMWFANHDGSSLGRITTAGVVTSARGVGDPADSVLGPDGNMWFTNPVNHSIGRMTPAGAVSFFGSPEVASPRSIAMATSGDLWFTDPVANRIGRITAAGTIATFSAPSVAGPTGIASGPDGALWFTNETGGTIGRVTTAGAISSFTDPAIQRPHDIVTGPDGALWFTNGGGTTIGRITTGGAVTSFPTTLASAATEITAGPDGALWFTAGSQLMRITTDGEVSLVLNGVVRGISVGPDGNVWAGQFDTSVVRITPAGDHSTYTTASTRSVVTTTPGPSGSVFVAGDRGTARIQAVESNVPDAPTAVAAAPDDSAAVVRWTAPVDAGASPITGYTVTASPGGATCTTSGATTCTVSGLTNGTPHTFAVRATNGSGQGFSSLPSLPVTPIATPAGAWFHPVTPSRLVDSRPAGPSVGGYTTPWGPGQTRDVAMGGVSPVPAGAAAVVLNITVVSQSGGGYLTVWPKGQPEPIVSSLNYSSGQTVANQVTIKLGAGGGVSIRNRFGTADVIVDVNGYYDGTEGDGFVPLTPARVVDSRPTGPSVGGFVTPWPTTPRDVQIGGVGGVPPDADAVVLNVTAVGPSTGSYLTIWPAGQARPLASSINFPAGQVVPNAVTVKLGSSGKVSIANAFGSVDVIVDVAGYFANGDGASFHPVVPARIQDSRPSGPGVGPYATPWPRGVARTVQVSGLGGIPTGALALVGNVTAAAPSSGSYVTVWPTGYGRPLTSTLNFSAGQTVPNASTVKLGPGGSIAIVNAFGSVDVIVDASGWYG